MWKEENIFGTNITNLYVAKKIKYRIYDIICKCSKNPFQLLKEGLI